MKKRTTRKPEPTALKRLEAEVLLLRRELDVSMAREKELKRRLDEAVDLLDEARILADDVSTSWYSHG